MGIQPSSFRLRIALASVLFSGTALALAGIAGWLMIERLNFEHLDREVRDLGLRELARSHRSDRWAHWERASRFVFEESDEVEANAFLMVWDSGGRLLHTSSLWPEDLLQEQLPTPGPPVDLSSLPIDPFGPGAPPGQGAMPGQGQGPGPGPGQGFFRRQDLNRDGRVSLAEFEGTAERFHLMDRNSDGFLTPGESTAPSSDAGGNDAANQWILTEPSFLPWQSNGTAWRVAVMSNPEVTMALGVSAEDIHAEMKRVAQGLAVGFPLALLLIALSGWVLAGRALRPVRALSAAAEKVTASGLDQRIESHSEPQEFARLIEVFNQMLDRLQRSFEQANRFSADAAHELHTPLTILQGQLEQAIQSEPAGSNQQQTCAGLLEEVQRLKSIVRKLLMLAQADSSGLKLNVQPVALDSLIEEALEDSQILAPTLRFESKIQTKVSVAADEDLMAHVLQNLLSNAIKYNHENGVVRVELSAKNGRVQLLVANTGAPIPEDSADRIFDRFFRGDKAHNRQIDGTGLGLSLAREIVKAHGGELRLKPRSGDWTIFVVNLGKTSR